MEEAKVREAQLYEEIKVLVAEKFEVFNKLEGLAGLPEKYVKQVNPSHEMPSRFLTWGLALRHKQI